MLYTPYWFESFAPCLSWVVPFLAIVGLGIARTSVDSRVQRLVERTYFAAMFLVAAATLRTVIIDEGCWLLHTVSMGAMVLGAAIPKSKTSEDLDSDIAWTDS